MHFIEGNKNHKAYEILSFEEDAVVLGCEKGALKIGTLQPVSKKAMTAKAYCVGRGMKVGDFIL